MRKLVVLVAVAAALLSVAPVSAVGHNVAAGATVSLNGDAFFTAGWGGGQIVAPSTVVDGVFLPRGTQWDQGAVWWDQNDGRKGEIIIDLGEPCVIESLTVQADDNDAYIVRYEAPGGGKKLAWNVPNYDIFGTGMQTRPDPADDTAVHQLQGDIVATKLFVRAAPNASNDRFFSVSEVQAFGYCF